MNVGVAFHLSTQQQRLWPSQEENSSYLATAQVALNGALDGRALKKAVRQVIARNEILRTVFERRPGLKFPFQVVREDLAPDWIDLDLGQVTASEQDSVLEYFEKNLGKLDLQNGPTLVIGLVRVGPEKHLLLIGMPSVLTDYAGMINLIGDIGVSYEASLGGQATDTDVMQYADLAAWQDEMLSSEDTKPGRDFWLNCYRNLDVASTASALQLIEKRNPLGERFSPRTVHRQLTGPSLAGISAAFDGLAPSEVLAAAWHAFLHRVTRSPEITIAHEFDGRNFEGLEKTLGLLSKYLPVPSNLPLKISFLDFAKEIHRMIAAARDWQQSFSQSHLESIPGLGSIAPLPLAFSYQERPEEREYAGVKFRIEEVEAVAEAYAVKLEARKQGDSVILKFQYDASRVDGETLEQWCESYSTFLAAGLEKPETAIDRLPILSTQQRKRVLVEFNRTEEAYPKAKCVQELFEERAERWPERVAVQSEERKLTYRELNEEANRLAHELRSRGAGANARVGLMLERGVDMLVGVLGIVKAGGAYVPLSTDNPKTRLAQQLEGAAAVITEAKLKGKLPEFQGPVLCLGGISREWGNRPSTNPKLETTADSLVYVIYTSGSTGVPKGVGVRHRNLVNYAHSITKKLELEKRYPDGLRFATVSTLAADLGNTCIYPALMSGGTVHVVPYEVSTNSQQLERYLEKYDIDVLKIVPSHLSALLDGGMKALPRRYLITGGELLKPELVEKVEGLHSSCELINHYGPTETTVGSLMLRLRDFDWRNTVARSIPIGRPLANTRVYVLDEELQPVPIGAAGELYIAGAGVAAGYLGQAEKTAERFLEDPFSLEEAAKMYRTGDRARYLNDGNVEFLGRADDQVKIRGFRVELGEIEAALSQHAGVKQALVLARENEQGEKRLLGYVVAQRKELTGEELRAYLKQEVPDYMVPQAIAVVAKFPLTPNGKIDRAALPEPEAGTAHRAYLAPRNQTEQKIAEIWAEVLRRDLSTISIADNFFDLGGHSLMATQVVSRIRRTLSVELPLRTLFEHASINDLALEIHNLVNGKQNRILPLVRVSRDKPLPLSFAQQRLWVLDRIEPDNPLYNISRAVQLKGQLDITSLVRALNEIVRRHESQRTTFNTGKDGQPVQIIAESLELNVPTIDLTNCGADREHAARDMATQEAKTPFDLSVGPLLRAKILKLGADDHILLLTMHHIVSDAWSAGIFFQELAALYEAFKQGLPSPLTELSVQYADYAAWQRAYLEGQVLDEQLNYWREHLRGAPPVLALPSDRPHPQVRTFAGAYEAIPLATDVALKVTDFSRTQDATPFMVLLAAFTALLSRYSGQQNIVLGTDIANRTTAETERIIGFFINLLPLHTDLNGNPSFEQLVSRVREKALGAYAHQDLPFDKLVEDLRPERSLSHNPIVQALFVMQNIPPQPRQLSGLEMRYFPVPVTRSKFDVAVFIRESNGTTFQDWIYSSELFDRSTILRMAENYETLLRDALSHPEKRVSDLQIQSEEEKRQREAERNARKQTQRKKLGAAQPKSIQLDPKEPGK